VLVKYLAAAFSLYLVQTSPLRAEVDTVVRDYDISFTQTECRQSAMRVFQSLALPGSPVRELGHVIYYTDATSELIAVCRADRGVLVLFTRGPLTGPAHIGFSRQLR
jgi:hypothetical protein